jgi:hypothetical protein
MKKAIIKFIDRVGFFRLTLIPIGLVITISAYFNNILGMGIVGLVIIVFGMLNKCLLLGTCEIEDDKK